MAPGKVAVDFDAIINAGMTFDFALTRGIFILLSSS